MAAKTAKIAVSAATYWVDRPFDYLIPQELMANVKPGVRVTVPFGRGNKRSEGIVLALGEDKGEQKRNQETKKNRYRCIGTNSNAGSYVCKHR